ncbi:MAG: phospholipase D-like domain-containing protein [Halioglobus sp.]
MDIREYVGGLLHSKTLTLDGEITLIGSANMDRRSFDLNFENNILLYDPQLTQAVRVSKAIYTAPTLSPGGRAELAAAPPALEQRDRDAGPRSSGDPGHRLIDGVR